MKSHLTIKVLFINFFTFMVFWSFLYLFISKVIEILFKNRRPNVAKIRLKTSDSPRKWVVPINAESHDGKIDQKLTLKLFKSFSLN